MPQFPVTLKLGSTSYLTRLSETQWEAVVMYSMHMQD